MKSLSLALVFCVLAVGLVSAEVVRPAPDVRWLDSSGKTQTFSAFKGQAIVLLIAPSPETRAFRSQLRRLQGISERLGAQKVVFVAAFTQSPGRIPSNIPFALAADGPKVGADYGVSDHFSIAVIGPDGNLDCLSSRTLPGQRVYDIVMNSFSVQQAMRRQ